MKHLFTPKQSDLDDIVEVDCEVIGSDCRRDFIAMAIEEGRCIAASTNGAIIGFLIYDTHFFECSFISLIIVKPSARRQGIASSLIQYFCNLAPTKKIFSSTNQSNTTMQKVFEANGFIQSGSIENLDEGDPEMIYFRNIGET